MNKERLPSIAWLALALGLLFSSGCGAGAEITETPAAAPQPSALALPTARLTGGISLEEALATRRSVREFTAQRLAWEEVSQLLWSAQGTTDPRGLRTAPSAGALYPLEVYVVLPDGAYHYLAERHTVERVSDRDLREDLWRAGLRQDALRQAPAVFVITAVYERTEAKYGERAERYVELEAGHAAQNLLLEAVALDLGAVPIGAFDDDQVGAALSLPADHKPLYLIPVGHPRE
jgi:SagB-type dehydrogenase family enzyme